MKIPLIYNVRSMLHRPSTTVATAIGIALVVVTFVGMLALANGFAPVSLGPRVLRAETAALAALVRLVTD